MTFAPRLVVVMFAAFFVAGLAMSVSVPLLAGRRRSGSPANRAGALLYARLLPTLASIAACGLAVLSFLRFEPRNEREPVGMVLAGAAVLGGLLLIRSAGHWIRLTRATRRVLRTWMADAEPLQLAGIDIPAWIVRADFPIVAVVGIRRPQLVVARAVIDCCTPDELRVIVRHESSHRRRRDNLARALFRSVPDVLSSTPLAQRLAAHWDEAAEQAADEEAAGTETANRLALAETLIRVARLAQGAPPADLPASALYRGENLQHRVARLLGAPAPGGAPSAWRRLLPAAVVLAGCTVALHTVHDLVEAAVTFLP